MGIRPPSLYVYFDGKNALYDALFELGWRALRQTCSRCAASRPRRPRSRISAPSVPRSCAGRSSTLPMRRSCSAPRARLAPTEQAYGPAVDIRRLAREFLADLQQQGVLRPDVDLEVAYSTWTSATSGVMTQQLSNAPGEPFETGTFTSTLPGLMPVAGPLRPGGGPPSD